MQAGWNWLMLVMATFDISSVEVSGSAMKVIKLV
jgi:hypothetical protein